MASVGLKIGPADHGRRLTLDEFREAEEEEGYRYELARGVLEVVEVPNDPHGVVIYNLQKLLHRWDDAHPGIIYRIGGGSEFRLWIPEMVSGRNPDVAFVLRGTTQDARGRRPPSFAAEVVSEGGEERDYHAKREEYWVYGLREYWIIDMGLRQVLALVREEADWVERVYRGDDVLASDLLPGFAGRVADLWAGLDDEG